MTRSELQSPSSTPSRFTAPPAPASSCAERLRPALPMERARSRRSCATHSPASGGGDVDILNFALTLEYLESDFYLHKAKSVGLSGEAKSLAAMFGEQEQAHVTALMTTIKHAGGTPVKKPSVHVPRNRPGKLLEARIHARERRRQRLQRRRAVHLQQEILAAAGSIVQIEARHAAAIGLLIHKPVTPDRPVRRAPEQEQGAGQGRTADQQGMIRTPRHFRLAGLRRLADEELADHIRQGDGVAYEVLFERHGGAAFSLAYRMCGRRTLAEDIVQEAFLSLWRGRGFDPARGSVRSWVLAAVRHRALDSFRHKTAKTGRDVHDDVAAESLIADERTDAQVQREDDAQQVRGALVELPAEQRQVIELAYFGGFTHSEIAGMLDLPTGTVKGRMRLGLTKLRLSLADLAEAVA